MRNLLLFSFILFLTIGCNKSIDRNIIEEIELGETYSRTEAVLTAKGYNMRKGTADIAGKEGKMIQASNLEYMHQVFQDANFIFEQDTLIGAMFINIGQNSLESFEELHKEFDRKFGKGKPIAQKGSTDKSTIYTDNKTCIKLVYVEQYRALAIGIIENKYQELFDKLSN